ncbi:hypothetical protein LguiA_021230 [Lonicera macranthoides]
MAQTPSLLFLSLLFFLLTTTTHSFSPPHKKSPQTRAEALIRQLNLFPRHDVNIARNSSSGEAPAIVEKCFMFPSLVGAGNNSIQDLGHHAGYYRIPHTIDARMFYFFFESRRSKADPVVIWLTGGPGCGSELALFYENGPFHIANDLTLSWNDFGWDKVSNMIYVDQPTGTGFSYSSSDDDIRHNELGVSTDLYNFLQEFFKAHPDYAKNDFFITGESYAGHYIPAFAARVHQGNKNKEGIPISLKGFAIGNGLTDPAVQYKAYTDYALSMNIISQSDYDDINQSIPECEQAIQLCGTDGDNACMNAYSTCNVIFDDIMNLNPGKNYYDIRKLCTGNLCYDFSNMEELLNQQLTRDALGVGRIEFVSCSSTVSNAMITDWMKDLEVGIPALLEDGINMLIYAGEYDFICNWLGNSRWVAAVKWSGQKAFVGAPTVSFSVDGAEAGQMKSYGPLIFLKIDRSVGRPPFALIGTKGISGLGQDRSELGKPQFALIAFLKQDVALGLLEFVCIVALALTLSLMRVTTYILRV